MKRNFNLWKHGGLLMTFALLLCSVFGIGGTGNAVFAEEGTIIYGEAVSVDYALTNAPEIVKAVIDREVIVIKPHLTPLYTIGANHAVKNVDAQSSVVKYDEVEMVPLKTTVAASFSTAGQTSAYIDLADNDMVSVNETLYFKEIPGYKEDGTTLDGGWFVGYIKDKDTSGRPIIVPVNGVKSGAVTNSIPALASGTVVIRGARTASEKQSRTAPLAVVPVQKENYMQKMIIETEETTMFILNQEIADVKWGKTEITDFAIAEHKMSTEADTLLGKKRLIKAANKYNQNKVEPIYFQEGVYWQAGKDADLPTNAVKKDLITMMKAIFTGNHSSNTKIALLGADVIETINSISDYDSVIYPGKPGQAFGMDVARIIYGQYTLMIIHEPAFDDVAMADKGLVIDESYLYKHSQGWRTINLDNLKNGDSDSQSQVLIEQFCYTLKNAKAHCRISLV
jgi:hypothetical protein